MNPPAPHTRSGFHLNALRTRPDTLTSTPSVIGHATLCAEATP